MKFNFDKQGHMVDILFTLALFCVFAGSALLVVLIGANVYKTTIRDMGENFNTRTSLTYVSTKAAQNDMEGAVFLTDLEGTQALVLEKPIAGDTYQTWIYYHDGSLCEVFVKKGTEMTLSSGSPIVDVPMFRFEQVDLTTLRMTSVNEAGDEISMVLRPRCSAAR